MALDQEIQDLIDKTDIVSLVSRYVKLEKQGKNYRGLCPFHSEDTPSFLVSPEKNFAHCFGCQKGGNPLQFLMNIENLDFKDAVKKLAEFNNVKLSGGSYAKKENPLTKYFKIMQTSVNFYKKNLEMTLEGKKAIEYLHKRGMTDELIQKFQVGLSPKPGDTLYQVLKESQFLELDMTDVGLVDKGARGYYDLFSSRIMFPIFDETGNPIGFSARIYDEKDKNQPKYINSRDTILFKKDQTFFNLNQAKLEILKKKRIILHEGQMDVIASCKSGLNEAVCSLGTGLSPKKASILAKYAKSIVICFDGDKAGINASLKAINIFKEQGFDIHLVLLPDGMDPDEYVSKYGPKAYLDYFEANIIDANSYIFKQAFLNKNLNDAVVLDSVKNEIFSMLMNISNTEREKYLRALSEKLGVSIDSVGNDFNNYYNRYGGYENVDNSYQGGNISYIEYDKPKQINELKCNCELRLFMFAKHSKDMALYIDRKLNDRMEALSVENQRLWIALINSYYEKYEVFNEALYLQMLPHEDVVNYIANSNRLKRDINKYTREDLEDCLNKLLEIKCDKQNEIIDKKLSELRNDEDKIVLINNKFINRRKKEQLKNNRRN